MDRKKIITIILLAILIVGAVAIIVRTKNTPTDEQKAFADTFARKMQDAKSKNITGSVASVDDKKVAVRLGQEYMLFDIDQNIAVTVIDSAKKSSKGQPSDIKYNDNINIEYDAATRKVLSIIVAKR